MDNIKKLERKFEEFAKRYGGTVEFINPSNAEDFAKLSPEEKNHIREHMKWNPGMFYQTARLRIPTGGGPNKDLVGRKVDRILDRVLEALREGGPKVAVQTLLEETAKLKEGDLSMGSDPDLRGTGDDPSYEGEDTVGEARREAESGPFVRRSLTDEDPSINVKEFQHWMVENVGLDDAAVVTATLHDYLSHEQ